MFAQVYTCPECGDVDAQAVEIVDTERDECWIEHFCKCGRAVRPKLIDGRPVVRALTDEEIFWDMLNVDDEESEIEW
jgi:hypothetical protein